MENGSITTMSDSLEQTNTKRAWWVKSRKEDVPPEDLDGVIYYAGISGHTWWDLDDLKEIYDIIMESYNSSDGTKIGEKDGF